MNRDARNTDPDGETIEERWAAIDDYLLVQVATKLGLLNKKAGKTLEMINWMRSHGSAAHLSDDRVGREDVIAFAILLQKNLFEAPFPDPGHSVSSLFDPVRSEVLDDATTELLRDQVRALPPQDVKVAFGFMLDLLCKGEPPSVDNVRKLFPTVWERASDELKKAPGLRYHTFTVNKNADDSSDGKARLRILEFLIDVHGVKFIPDSARAVVFRLRSQIAGEGKRHHLRLFSRGIGCENACTAWLLRAFNSICRGVPRDSGGVVW